VYNGIMNIIPLQQSGRLFFTTQNIAEILGISEASARVLGARYAKKGILVRLKNNIYLLESQIARLGASELFQLSNLIQTPSYVSFMTALAYHGVTTQITREVVEAISPVRTGEFKAKDLLFVYSKIQPDLYFGFERVEGFFIASKEKALLDCLYFSGLGQYKLDVDSLDLSLFSAKLLHEFVSKFSPKTQKLLDEIISSR